MKATLERDGSVARLYAEHAHGLSRLAVLVLGSEAAWAEDVVQEAFLALHKRFGDLRDQDSAVPYLRSCVLNGCRSRIRRLTVARRHVRVDVPSPSAELSAVGREDHREVLMALSRLPARQREAVVLRYWSGLGELEIAAAMGVSAGSVKTHTSRAMASLRQDLGGLQ